MENLLDPQANSSWAASISRDLYERLVSAGVSARATADAIDRMRLERLFLRLNRSWGAGVLRPDIENINRIGAKDWNAFVLSGNRIAGALYAILLGFFGDSLYQKRILEFGCGYGRVFLPLHHGLELDLFGCDVNAGAIKYMRKACGPKTNVRVTEYEPPLPYRSGAFDCVYSISIWTHLPMAMQMRWLEEVRRILKPGGLALISTSGHRALQSRHAREDKAWLPISSDDLRKEGVIYREYEALTVRPEKFPGITSSYGKSAHDPAYIVREWSKVMPVQSVQEVAIGVAQDLVVLRRD